MVHCDHLNVVVCDLPSCLSMKREPNLLFSENMRVGLVLFRSQAYRLFLLNNEYVLSVDMTAIMVLDPDNRCCCCCANS